MSKDTLFTNDSGAAGGAVDYVKDVFDDLSLRPTNNTGLTDNASTNPLGDLFANTDAPKYGAKTLYIKDLYLLPDRSKWVSNKPTYRVIWHEACPGVNGYLFGDIVLGAGRDQPVVTVRTIGDGMGVTGKIRRIEWLVNDDTAATATAQLQTDGANGNTIDFSGLGYTPSYKITRFSAFIHAAANETNDLHDYRIKANQASTLRLIGAVVYFENAGANVEFSPGTSYVDKSKVTSTSGSSVAVSTFGSSLGGTSLYYKTQASGYAVSDVSAATVTSIAQGSSGTNLISVSAGHGASFPAGAGIVVAQGTSMFVGGVKSVSTDTLTVGPTLTLGLSNVIYRGWLAGPTYAISASLYTRTANIDFSEMFASRVTEGAGTSTSPLPYYDPKGRYAVWGTPLGYTSQTGGVRGLCFTGANRFIQVDGYFSAAEIETYGSGTFQATLSINGIPSWSISEGHTGLSRKTLMTEAGPGWNSIVIAGGASMGDMMFPRINLYTRSRDQGVTFGALARLDTLQAFTDRTAINASLMALGTARRTYAEQIYLKGTWSGQVGASFAGGAQFITSSASTAFQLQYYGKNFALIGSGTGGSLTVDGAFVPVTFNAMQTVATEGFHTVQYTGVSGQTIAIQAIDYTATRSEMNNLQHFDDDDAELGQVRKRIIARYRSAGTQVLSDSTFEVLDFGLLREDTHGAVTTGSAWDFTSPRRAKYRVDASWALQSTGLTAITEARIYKNGVVQSGSVKLKDTINSFVSNPVSDILDCNAGDSIRIYAFQNVGGAANMQVSSLYNWVNIEEITE